ncbi:NADH:flavin oxidoreductase/NADH oxidase [Fibrisoma limi BUZ 3]|uniref:NADH:flavin oxidoreductase/NADH oxidase n=1 Tax=Fibrisoma limi BUZ 3 TaxID=1185876 RepID=I2GPU8_9BACT|nr:alkene reductase [Fibrisoma limi]CCH55926.1 NADH:flavin oxidoreductase/NADH oxidase [Fibrisoma limi BUZ 3]
MASVLFSKAQLGNLTLQNHIAMAPMTRNRATADHIPTDIMATYYAQRASIGLIITEGTAPSPNGEGYARIPGIHNAAQVAAWKKVTDAVHEKGGKIFVQLMHTGRIGHHTHLAGNAEVVAPSAIAAAGDIYTDEQGMQPHPTPRELTAGEVKATIQEFVTASQNAIEAGFDGVELHGANGYLIEQFISPDSNQRTDEYGGSIENRSRFLLDIAEATGKAIGFDKVGVRLSPYGVFNDIKPYADVDQTYFYITEKLNELGVVYVHLVDHSSMGAPIVPDQVVDGIRERFKGALILSGGYDADRAEAVLQSGKADLVAFGRPVLANPDFVERLKIGAELNQPDFTTFYTPGEKGYIDYPVLEEVNG